MTALDKRGRELEHLNLPQRSSSAENTFPDSDRCRELLAQALTSDSRAITELKSRAKVADNYQIWSRRLGLYSIT